MKFYEDKKIRETYIATKRITSTLAHLLAVPVTGGWSLVYSATVLVLGLPSQLRESMINLLFALDGLSDPPRMVKRDIAVTSDDIEERVVLSRFYDKKNPKSAAIAEAVKRGLIQTFTRPFAYAAIGIGLLADSLGYFLKVVPSAAAVVSRNGDETLTETWSKEHKKMVWTNSIRDIFWSTASLTPDRDGAHNILDNSALGISKGRVAAKEIFSLKYRD